MLQWRYAADSAAIGSEIGSLSNGVLHSNGRTGFLLTGPYVDVPAGRCTARFRLDGPAEGQAIVQIVSESGKDVMASESIDLDAAMGEISIDAYLPAGARRMEVRFWCEEGCAAAVSALEIDAVPERPAAHDRSRSVGSESLKSYPDKVDTGFIDRYLSGDAILEVGFRGYEGAALPIVPQAVGVDVGYPGYDGIRLPFADESFDAIYSSHCLEHIADYKTVLRDWYRVLKIGGYLIIAVPHQHLYEKRRSLPSRANYDHQRYYTSESLLGELAEAFGENRYRVRSLVENDRGYDYSRPPKLAAIGNYEIEVVVEKIRRPDWSCDDGSVRAYAANEFISRYETIDPWSLLLPAPAQDEFVVWGPYVALEQGNYEALFYFDTNMIETDREFGGITLEVALQAAAVARLTLSGSDGLRALSSGPLALRFKSKSGAPDAFEFRIMASAESYRGQLVFRGIDLRYASAAEDDGNMLR